MPTQTQALYTALPVVLIMMMSAISSLFQDYNETAMNGGTYRTDKIQLNSTIRAVAWTIVTITIATLGNQISLTDSKMMKNSFWVLVGFISLGSLIANAFNNVYITFAVSLSLLCMSCWLYIVGFWESMDLYNLWAIPAFWFLLATGNALRQFFTYNDFTKVNSKAQDNINKMTTQLKTLAQQTTTLQQAIDTSKAAKRAEEDYNSKKAAADAAVVAQRRATQGTPS